MTHLINNLRISLIIRRPPLRISLLLTTPHQPTIRPQRTRPFLRLFLLSLFPRLLLLGLFPCFFLGFGRFALFEVLFGGEMVDYFPDFGPFFLDLGAGP
jgi:hypothetical protein